MKTKLSFALIFFLICFLNTMLSGQTDTTKKPEYYKVSEVRIYITDHSDVFNLRNQGLGFEHIKLQDNYFDAILDSVQIEKLKKSGYNYEILIEDVTKDYLERTKDSREKIKIKKPCQPLGFGYGSMGGFFTFSEVVAQLDTMRLLYPNLITAKDSIGASIEGRPIWAVKISDNPDVNENEPQVFYSALTHANEQQGMMTVIYFMYYLLENYGTNAEVTYLVDNREFYFVPVVNPDGYFYNELISPNGGGMWRKNRRNSGGGIYGVDLNRNYGYMWGYDNIGSSPYPQDWNYRGTGPFSEPETQSIRNFCINKNFLTASNYHTYWNVLFPPWGYNLLHTPDSSIFNSLIMLATTINGYRHGLYLPPAENYPSNGDALDWMYGETNEKNRIFGVIPEVGGEDDGGCWPPPQKIVPLAEENLYANFIYAWGPGVIDNPPYIKDGAINLRFCRSLIDTLRISAIEYNPDNYTSYVHAEFLNSNDSLINQVQLNKIGSTFSGEYFFGTTDENFYKIIFRQSAVELPSNIYSSGRNKLRFTTAGPVVLDSVDISYNSLLKFYKVFPYVRNAGSVTTIPNASIELVCYDPWITTISSPQNLPDILPGTIVTTPSYFSVRVDSTFAGSFNFKFNVRVDGWTYWTDSTSMVVGVEEDVFKVPTEFSLEQNFPNPFNPITKIKYSVPQTSQVQIKVFDVLGNEVETLVNEEKPTGTYELNWYAANLPSGVYFYQLKAGDYLNTKKMILLK